MNLESAEFLKDRADAALWDNFLIRMENEANKGRYYLKVFYKDFLQEWKQILIKKGYSIKFIDGYYNISWKQPPTSNI